MSIKCRICDNKIDSEDEECVCAFCGKDEICLECHEGHEEECGMGAPQ